VEQTACTSKAHRKSNVVCQDNYSVDRVNTFAAPEQEHLSSCKRYCPRPKLS